MRPCSFSNTSAAPRDSNSSMKSNPSNHRFIFPAPKWNTFCAAESYRWRAGTILIVWGHTLKRSSTRSLSRRGRDSYYPQIDGKSCRALRQVTGANYSISFSPSWFAVFSSLLQEIDLSPDDAEDVRLTIWAGRSSPHTADRPQPALFRCKREFP